MDKGYMKGRKSLAVALMIAVAVLAFPAMAHAAAVFTSHQPAKLASVKVAPVTVGVDVSGVDVKTATISVNGSAKTAKVNVVDGANGTWTYSEVADAHGVFHPHWAWAAGAVAARTSLIADPGTLAVGSYTLVAAGVDKAGVAFGPETWTFDVVANGTYTPPSVVGFDNTSCTSASACHIHSAASYANDNAMGPNCTQSGCHIDGFAPAHTITPSASSMGSAHDDLAAYISGSSSSACSACHGNDVSHVATKNGDGTYTVPNVGGTLEHNGCSCHLYGEAEALKGCVDCHQGGYGAIHGWASQTGPYNSTLMTASGHSTAAYGKIGGHTKWDGEEGVVVKDSTNATITQEWPLPTASVFWSQSKALNMDGTVNNAGVYSLNPTDAPAVAMANRGGSNMDQAINKNVGWDSVITCEDCHTALEGNEAVGPHGGATFANAGLDPNFPDDWTKAEITSFDPTGMRKIDTVRDTTNPYYTKLNASIYMPAEVVKNGVAVADQADALVGLSIETTQKPHFALTGNLTAGTGGAPGIPANDATTGIKPGGFYGYTNAPSAGYSMGDSTGRFICQKCHKLTNSFQGLSIEGNGRGARDNALNYMGMSNEAHMEHHNDMVTGQGNCVSCHIAIPHGWKRPRLLVYESDPAPYKVQQVWADYRSTDQNTLRNMAPSNLLTSGNWGFLSNSAATTASRYQDLTASNAFTGAANSSHLEKISAAAGCEKELEVGVPAEEFTGWDAQNGTSWGKWLMSAEGVAWPGDSTTPGAAKINLSAWDLDTNAAVTVVNGDSPIQNNCTACTSAAAGTHAPQNGTNTGGEGVNDSQPYWK